MYSRNDTFLCQKALLAKQLFLFPGIKRLERNFGEYKYHMNSFITSEREASFYWYTKRVH